MAGKKGEPNEGNAIDDDSGGKDGKSKEGQDEGLIDEVQGKGAGEIMMRAVASVLAASLSQSPAVSGGPVVVGESLVDAIAVILRVEKEQDEVGDDGSSSDSDAFAEERRKQALKLYGFSEVEGWVSRESLREAMFTALQTERVRAEIGGGVAEMLLKIIASGVRIDVSEVHDGEVIEKAAEGEGSSFLAYSMRATADVATGDIEESQVPYDYSSNEWIDDFTTFDSEPDDLEEIKVDVVTEVSTVRKSPFENLDLSRIFEFLLDKEAKEILENFMKLDAIEHVEARKILIQTLGGSPYDEKYDTEKVRVNMACGEFYSSNPSQDEASNETQRERELRIKRDSTKIASAAFNAMCNNPHTDYFFIFVEAWATSLGFSARTAGSLPRQIVSLKEFDVKEGDQAEFLRYRIFFLELWHRAMKAFKDQTGEAFHRDAYTMAQIAAKLTLEQFGPDEKDWVMIPPGNRKVPAPSLQLFADKKIENNDDVELVDNYIRANLSLILPDRKDGDYLIQEDGSFRNMAQEEFAIFDLIALADKFGLHEKYKKIFEAIFEYRRAQFAINFHFNPKATKHPNAEEISLIRVMEQFYKRNKRLPFVGDWGDGRGQNGRLLLHLGIAEKVFGIDIDKNTDVDSESLEMDGKYHRVKIGVKGLSDDEIRNKIFEKFPQVDVFLACDVAHECSDPKKYIPKFAKEKVNEGGMVYITDPAHCEPLDRISGSTVNRFDSTAHPTSMNSLEEWFNLDAYLTLKGFNIEGIYPVSGVASGYNDPFWRLKHVLYKVPASQRRTNLYSVPKPLEVKDSEIDLSLGELDEVYKVWPLCLIEEEMRGKLTGIITPFVRQIFEESGEQQLTYRSARKIFLRALLSHKREKEGRTPFLLPRSSLTTMLKNPIRNRLGYLSKAGEVFPDSKEEMLERRKACREAIYVIEIMRDIMGIDMSEQARKFPGWETFDLWKE